MQKLKRKFVLMSWFSMLAVLFVVLGLVNGVTYNAERREIYSLLTFILDNSGELPAKSAVENTPERFEVTPETQYETRYFIVKLDSSGKIVSFDGDHIASVEKDDTDEILKRVRNCNDDRSIFRFEGMEYAYQCREIPEGTEIAFLDCTRRMEATRSVVKFSCYIGVASMLLLILVLSVFSRKAVEPLIRNMKAQKQFITNAGHELKTPLAVISANTEVLEMTNGKNEWTESTLEQVKRMSSLISQLVVLSKLEERTDLVLTEVDFSGEVQKTANDFHTVVETAGKKLETEIMPDLKIMADTPGARELANILVDNAAKYCDDGGTVRITLTSRGKNVIFTVSNDYRDGEGKDYRRFFERFYREDQSHTHQKEEKNGFGIGLSMADSLVRMFHGKISVGFRDGVITFAVVFARAETGKGEGK